MHTNSTPNQLGPINAARLAHYEKSPPPFLSFRQAAELVGVSVRTFRSMLAEPWMPVPIQCTDRVKKIYREELIEAIASRAPRRATRGTEPAQLAAARSVSKAGVPV